MADETKPQAPQGRRRDYAALLAESAAYRLHSKGIDVQVRGDTITADLYGTDAARLGRIILDVLSGHGYAPAQDIQFHPLYLVVKEA